MGGEEESPGSESTSYLAATGTVWPKIRLEAETRCGVQLREQPWCDFRGRRSPEGDLGHNQICIFNSSLSKEGKVRHQETAGCGQEEGGQRQGKVEGASWGLDRTPWWVGSVQGLRAGNGGRSIWET